MSMVVEKSDPPVGQHVGRSRGNTVRVPIARDPSFGMLNVPEALVSFRGQGDRKVWTAHMTKMSEEPLFSLDAGELGRMRRLALGRLLQPHLATWQRNNPCPCGSGLKSSPPPYSRKDLVMYRIFEQATLGAYRIFSLPVDRCPLCYQDDLVPEVEGRVGFTPGETRIAIGGSVHAARDVRVTTPTTPGAPF